MLISGLWGRANQKYAIEMYRSLFAEKVGREIANRTVDGTQFIPFVKRVWKLEVLYVNLCRTLDKS